jgi:hypothetical protein
VSEEGREGDLAHRHGRARGALHGEGTLLELEVVLAGLEQVRGDPARLLDDLLGSLDHGRAADGERPRAVAVEALRRRLGVAVEDLDVLERNTELIGHDLAERGLMPLPVRAGADDDLDLAGCQHAHRRVLPTTGAEVQRPQHAGGSQPAHLGEGRDAQAELYRILAITPLGPLALQVVPP